MTRFLITTAAVMLSTAASANDADVIVQAAPTAHVSYSDLNLHSTAGRETLVGRIRSAAGSLCIDANVDPLDIKVARMVCYRTAVSSGTKQMNMIDAN